MISRVLSGQYNELHTIIPDKYYNDSICGVAGFRKALESTSDGDFMKNWSLMAGGKAIFKLPRIAVYRGMLMNHMIHHRAQLTVYLRMNDIPVSSIYGPSADEDK